MRESFISRHLMQKIYDLVKEKQVILENDHFFYFDEPVLDNGKQIDRVNRWSPYYKDEILPQTFYGLQGKTLLEIFSKLKSNSFYAYKFFGTKSHKIRIED